MAAMEVFDAAGTDSSGGLAFAELKGFAEADGGDGATPMETDEAQQAASASDAEDRQAGAADASGKSSSASQPKLAPPCPARSVSESHSK